MPGTGPNPSKGLSLQRYRQPHKGLCRALRERWAEEASEGCPDPQGSAQGCWRGAEGQGWERGRGHRMCPVKAGLGGLLAGRC